jgi:hypothetical protein
MALKTYESNKNTCFGTEQAFKTTHAMVQSRLSTHTHGTKKLALKTHESKKSTRYDTALALKTLSSLIKHTQWYRAGFETARQSNKNTRVGTEQAFKTHAMVQSRL